MDIILTLNAGSSTLKAAAFTLSETPQRLFDIRVETPPGKAQERTPPEANTRLRNRVQDKDASWESYTLPQAESLPAAVCAALTDLLPQASLRAVGHRIVHGGERYNAHTRITTEVMEHLEEIAPLAPLHLPPELRCIRAIERMSPNLAQVSCFDTAFHRTQPRLATLFALPRNYTEEGVIRYGFHGLSYEYIASVLPEDAGQRVVVAHMGSGASMCALKQGRSIATSMGFSALDGLMMGTRCGAIDPGVLLYLMEEKGMDASALTSLLYKESGLRGVSGISNDMRELEASHAPEAKEAIDLFCYRAALEIGQLAMALGGLDAIVFTAGIGENSARVREGILEYTGWLGEVQRYVIPTDEEAMIARHTDRVVSTE